VQVFNTHPIVSLRFRRRVASIFGAASIKPREQARGADAVAPPLRVLVIQRNSGGRVVTNLEELLEREEVKQLPLEMRMVIMGQGDTATAAQQARAFLEADAVVGHHGAAMSLAVLLRPGSLVVEILNYRTKCDYFDSLFANCRLVWRRLFHQHGYAYASCHGSNRKTGIDDAPVDLGSLAHILAQFVAGDLAGGREDGDLIACCPACQRCGFAPRDVIYDPTLFFPEETDA
jgi:hypothetical protein